MIYYETSGRVVEVEVDAKSIRGRSPFEAHVFLKQVASKTVSRHHGNCACPCFFKEHACNRILPLEYVKAQTITFTQTNIPSWQIMYRELRPEALNKPHNQGKAMLYRDSWRT